MVDVRGCDFPADLHYHPGSHLWFAAEGDGIWRVGVTPFGVAIAGEILLFTSKPAGRKLAAGRAFGLLEAGKTVFAVKTPLAADLLDSNPALAHGAGRMNVDAYAAWLVKLRLDPAQVEQSLLPWPQARAEIEAQMDLWRFEQLADFRPPLLGAAAR
jgi:glycine cleavage system H protein